MIEKSVLMSWQEEWQGAAPLAGQEFPTQKQPLRLRDSREDALEDDPDQVFLSPI